MCAHEPSSFLLACSAASTFTNATRAKTFLGEYRISGRVQLLQHESTGGLRGARASEETTEGAASARPRFRIVSQKAEEETARWRRAGAARQRAGAGCRTRSRRGARAARGAGRRQQASTRPPLETCWPKSRTATARWRVTAEHASAFGARSLRSRKAPSFGFFPKLGGLFPWRQNASGHEGSGRAAGLRAA